MEKIIELNGKEYKFTANAAMAYLYKRSFGKDLITEFQKYAKRDKELPEGLLDTAMELAFIMARLAGQEYTKDDAELPKWLSQFNSNDMIGTILPEVLKLWQADYATTSTPKNA